MANLISIEIDPQAYDKVYGELETLYKMAEKIDTSMKSAQQSVQLTALRLGLAVSFLFNLVLLAVVAFTIGGN